MAALRGFSRLFRGFFSGVLEAVCWVTGRDFCASLSGRLRLAVFVPFLLYDSCSSVVFSGLLLFFGGGPAIDVSGMPVLGGGGGGGKSERLCDWYSGAV
jgi:hypothetical protein